ncbi:MAG TPA: ATP synthase F0 subunit B [Polyangiaceae bacterium]|nr:ATP synthase F0 subunit B [Polyangiaceae bacterium]
MSGWSVAFQVINFLVLAAVLRHFLFKPVGTIIEQRQQQIERQRAEAEGIRHEAEAVRSEVERARRELGTERTRLLEETREQIAKERREALATTRERAEALLQNAHGEIDHERELATEKIYREAVDLGILVARRLVEQVRSTNVAEAFLARLCEDLDERLPRQRSSLQRELDGAEVLIATAPALDADAQRRWLARITSQLGDGVRARFVQDEALIAGAELRLPHTSFSFSFRDGLRTAREELVKNAERR